MRDLPRLMLHIKYFTIFSENPDQSHKCQLYNITKIGGLDHTYIFKIKAEQMLYTYK